MNFKKVGFPQINYMAEGDPPAGGAAGAIATPPPVAGGFVWPADLDTGVIDTLKSKGMYDDPVKGAVGLAKSYHELNRLHSGAADVAAIPKADAPPAAWEAFHAKLGRPETPDKYEAKPVAGSAELQPTLVDFSKKLAHKWGVPAGKFNEGIAMVQQYMADENQRFIVDAKTASDAAVAKIRTTMGDAKFTESVGNAQKAFKVMASQGLISDSTLRALEQTVGAQPVIELMAAIGQRMGGEGSILTGVATPAPSDPTQMTPEQAKTEATRLMSDKDGFMKAYLDARHPDHNNSVLRMRSLFEAQHRNVT